MDYRINILDNMNNIIPVIGEIWWKHLENPMALWCLAENDLNLNHEWIDDKNTR